MFCTNCGKKLHDGDRFCGNCGTRVRVEEESKLRQEVVFNPPFKVEAERRTSEIFRGFAESTEEQEKPRKTEPAHFDWNLDGFPVGGPKKTEEVNFNWDSVVERKREQKKEDAREDARSIPEVPVVDKIDIHGAKESAPESSSENVPDPVKTPDESADASAGGTEVFRRESFKAEEESTEEAPETCSEEPPAEEPEIIMEESDDDANREKNAAELEKELFGKNYRGLAGADPDERAKNTAQLEKFYTFNEKKEAFQELLDKEYERLRSMEEERKPDAESLEFTWAGTLFPQQSGVQNVQEETGRTAAPEEKENPENAEAEPAAPSETAVPADTIDFTPIREETKLRNQMNRIREEVSGPADERTAEPEPEPETEPEQETAPVKEAAPEAEEEMKQENSSPSFSPDEKFRLRYSDVFPREGAPADSDDGGGSPAGADAQPGETEKRTAGPELMEIFDDEDDDEPQGMNPFVKFIVILLVLLIVLEGIILAAKFIAPDSAFSVKANALVESILDKVTGGSDAGDDDLTEPAGSDDIQETYLSGILRDRVPQPDTIGRVQEDVTLKYDSAKTYAFGDALAAATAFVDETWLTGGDGQTITKAQAMMTALVSYYDQWKATNKDTSLIGINKLEIGEIRTGEEGYYVLCRLTFAGADGEDVVKYVTANVKESQNSMIINEIKEETI